MFKKWVVFSLILMGNKRKIILTQEEISGREIVEVKFMGGEKKNKHLGGREEEDEFKKRNLGEKYGE